MNIILLVLAFIILTFINIREILNSNKIKKTLVFNMTLMLLAFTISVLLILGKAPIGPAYVIEAIVKSLMR